MNILGKEQPIIYKMDDMFDPTTAQMFLNAQQNYVNTMRQEYLQAAKDMKDFTKENSDFYSPFAADTKNYYDLTTGGVSKLIDQLRAKGIDPLRSMEGRAALQQFIYSRPYAQLANMKRSAKAGLEYLDAVKQLKAAGKYNKDFDDFAATLDGSGRFDNYDTMKSGKPFSRSPYEYNDLQTDTDNWYKGSEALYKGMEGGNRVYELNHEDLKNLAQPYINDYIKTASGQYRFRNIKDRLRAQNPMLTNDQLNQQAKNQFVEDIATAQGKYLRKKTFEADPFALEKYRNDLDLASYMQKKAVDAAYGGGSGSGGNQERDLFVESDANGLEDYGVQYKPSNSFAHRIDPSYNKGIAHVNGGFKIPRDKINGVLTTPEQMRNTKQNEHKTPFFGGENFVQAAVKQSGIPLRNIESFGTTEIGEMKTRYYKTKDNNGKERQHKVRAVAVNVWYRIPKIDVAATNSSRNTNKDVIYVKDTNGKTVYEKRYVKDMRTGKPLIRYQYVNERGPQYVTPNSKTKTFK